jgi:DNA-binding MarR family transcriptional regulator
MILKLNILKHIWQNSEDHSIKMADLVTYLHVTPAAISQMVNTFELSGLVEKYKSQDDKRANYVALHPDLISLVNKKKDILMDHAQAFHDSLSEEQQESLSGILNQLVDYLQKNYVFYDGNEN